MRDVDYNVTRMRAAPADLRALASEAIDASSLRRLLGLSPSALERWLTHHDVRPHRRRRGENFYRWSALFELLTKEQLRAARRFAAEARRPPSGSKYGSPATDASLPSGIFAVTYAGFGTFR
ncbi:MAG: hypothetical protein HYV09_10860 [Deltaproteobacteria bacterium]|nr:hypothetical protein [Deltaproteobacteria bacterium]